MTERKQEYEWKQISGSITVKGHPKFMEMMQKKQIDAQECTNHYLSANIINERTRRYRRGKNRCHRCGWHLLPMWNV